MGETFSAQAVNQGGGGINDGPTLEQQAAMQGEATAETDRMTPKSGSIQITPQESADHLAEPDKFEGKSREEIIASYRALEKLNSEGGAKPNQTADDAAKQTAGQAAGEPDARIPEAPAAPAADANAGLVETLTEAYAQTGEISPELRAKFTKETGLPDSLIDSHIASVQRTETDNMTSAQTIAGGPEAYGELVEWAAETLTESEREAYNSAVYSSNPDLAKMAVEGLKARFQRENGVSPNLLAGNRPNYGGVEAFGSEFEWQTARRSDQYAKDPAFRKQVEARLKRSMELGLI